MVTRANRSKEATFEVDEWSWNRRVVWAGPRDEILISHQGHRAKTAVNA